jgi:enoyl-CoA hydratase
MAEETVARHAREVPDGDVLLERDGPVAVLTLDRQAARNALNEHMLERLAGRLTELAEDRAVRAVILTGAGAQAFSAGADIRAMAAKGPQEARAYAALGHRVMAMIEDLPQPVIAAINGYALGGGCELALACDIRIAATTARLGQPEVKLGILPGWGATFRLPRIVGPGIARELIFTGRLVDAQEALRLGLVNLVVEPEHLMSQARALAHQIAAQAPLAVHYAKRALVAAGLPSREAASSLEMSLFSLCFTTRDRAEGMAAFLEKRTPEFRGE